MQHRLALVVAARSGRPDTRNAIAEIQLIQPDSGTRAIGVTVPIDKYTSTPTVDGSAQYSRRCQVQGGTLTCIRHRPLRRPLPVPTTTVVTPRIVKEYVGTQYDTHHAVHLPLRYVTYSSAAAGISDFENKHLE